MLGFVIVNEDDKNTIIYASKKIIEILDDNMTIEKLNSCIHEDDRKNGHLDTNGKIRIMYRGIYRWVTTEIHHKNDKKCIEIYYREDIIERFNFLNYIGHEMRNPLNGIVGMISLLEMTQLEEEQNNYINLLKDCSFDLMSVINDIIDYVKIGTGHLVIKPTPIQLFHCINSVNDIINSKAVIKNIDYTYTISDKISETIVCDENRLKQILMYMLNNSIKNTKQKISLDVSIDTIDNTERICFTIITNDLYVGIEDINWVIDRNFEYKHISSYAFGYLLFLIISKELIELMNGRINFTYEECTKRYIFTFYLDYIPYDVPTFIKRKLFILSESVSNRIKLTGIGQKYNTVFAYSDIRELMVLSGNDFNVGIIDVSGIQDIHYAVSLVSSVKARVNFIIVIKNSKQRIGPSTNHVVLNLDSKTMDEDLLHVLNQIYSGSFINKELSSSLQKLNVLVVDKDNVENFIYRKMFSNFEIKRVDIVENGKECMDKLSKNHYDIIFIDVNVQIVSYKEILNITKSTNSSKYVVAICMYHDPDRYNYTKYGFDDILFKPLNIESFSKCLVKFKK